MGAEDVSEETELDRAMSLYDSEYGRMMRGELIPGCTCELVREARGWESYNGPEPAEWEQNPDCPLHGFDE